MKINLSFQRQWKQDCQGIHCSPQQSQDWRFMKWRCQWQWPGQKVEPLPCSSLPLNWCHTTTTTLKFLQNLEWTRTNWKNQKKKDQTTFWCTLLKHICEIQLSMKPLPAAPQAAWDQAQETHPVLSWARNFTPDTSKTHQDDSEVKQLYLALRCKCSLTVPVGCQDLCTFLPLFLIQILGLVQGLTEFLVLFPPSLECRFPAQLRLRSWYRYIWVSNYSLWHISSIASDIPIKW